MGTDAVAGPLSGGDEPLTEINIIPFVDIVLVLLIIFMLTAPVMFAQSIPLELPSAATGEPEPGAELGIAILADGALLLNGAPAGLETLDQVLQQQSFDRALISADHDVRHGVVITVIDHLRRAGVERYALNIQPDEDEPASAP